MGVTVLEAPSWRDDSRAAKKRVALWLLQEVGQGEVFTKAMLREAFPGIEQIDRRMRDLRSGGWDILTAREDVSLKPDELRFVSMGDRVWETSTKRSLGLHPRDRRRVLQRDGFACVICGISAGEPYSDPPPRNARLTVTRLDGAADDAAGYITECDRCRSGGDTAVDVGSLIEAATKLSLDEREDLGQWISLGRRPRAKTEAIWVRYLRLAPRSRKDFEETLRRS